MTPPVSLPTALLAAAAGGLALDAVFPGLGWWPLAFVAVGLGLISLNGRTLRESVLAGTVFGAAFYFPHISWVAAFLGDHPLSWLPWIALASAEALIMGAFSPLITLAYRWFPTRWRGGGGAVLLSALVAGAWMTRELVLGSWPYGGFPWGRLGMSQSDSPFAHIASWIGISGLGFVMVTLCAMALQAGRRMLDHHVSRGGRTRSWWKPTWHRWSTLIPVGLTVGIMAVIPQYPTAPAGSLLVGSVQGNGPAGYADKREPGDVLDAQLDASLPLRDANVDLVLWPEGGVDRDPITDPGTGLQLTAAARSYGAPILVNAAINEDGETYNRSLLWTENGPGATHSKRYPVPFGEYVPDRWFFEAIAPSLIDMLQREYSAGTDAPLLDIDGTAVGLAICFDVAFDDVLSESVLGGSQLHLFQTNNADFRGTDQHLQQLAFARMRSIESGRSVVSLSTTGASQVFDPAGDVVGAIPADVAGAVVVDVELRDGVTPGIFLGPGIRSVLTWGTVASLVLLGFVTWSKSAKARRPRD